MTNNLSVVCGGWMVHEVVPRAPANTRIIARRLLSQSREWRGAHRTAVPILGIFQTSSSNKRKKFE